MPATTFDIQYNNARQALGSAQEPNANGVLYVNSTTFPPFVGTTINRWTFQFVEGDGGTLTIEVQGPSGAWSLYTNAEGQAATAIGVNDAYIVDTGNWTGFRCTFAGTDGSAVLSVLGWTASDTVPALTARVDSLETQVADLEAQVATLTPQTVLIPITYHDNADVDFIAVPWDAGVITAAKYTAAFPADTANGTLTVALYSLDDDTELVAPVSIVAETEIDLTIAFNTFAAGVYARVSSNDNAHDGEGMAIQLRYNRT